MSCLAPRAHDDGSQGFTLIELLVVIAIIGLLSSVILASLNTARTKAQTAARESDIHQIVNALYLASGSGSFPSSNGTTVCLGTNGTCWGGVASGNSALNATLQSVLPNIPVDPTHLSGLGDRFLYSDASTVLPMECRGVGIQPYAKGPFIFYEPSDTTNPMTKAQCPTGDFACCAAGIGCQPSGTALYFCAYQVP